MDFWLKQCNGDEASINSLSRLLREQNAEAGDEKIIQNIKFVALK